MSWCDGALSRSGPAAVFLLLILSKASVDAQEATRDVAQQAESRARITGGALTSGVQAGISSSTAFAPASPADSDLGEQVLLEQPEGYKAFSVSTDASFFWTSNAQLLDESHQSDTFLTTGVGVTYLPHLGGNFFAEFSGDGRIYRYARNAGLDFNAFSLGAGLLYVFRELGDLTVHANYHYDLLTQRGFNREIYHDHSLNAGLRKAFILSRAHLIYTAAGADFSLGGEPEYALSHSFFAMAGYQLGLTRWLKLDVYYRFAVQPYLQGSRTDVNQLVGYGLTAEITRWLSVQAAGNLAINSSNVDPYSYFAANLGGGISVLLNF
jgi:hypothetical protein